MVLRSLGLTADMNPSRNTKIGALTVVAVALVVAGGAFAAGKAPRLEGVRRERSLDRPSFVASSTNKTTRDSGPGTAPTSLAAAATYLGLRANLQTALQSGKTLAQVADATSNKSAAGLIAALVAAEKTELAAAVTAGKLTQAQADQMTTNLKARFTVLVNGVRPAHGGFGHNFGHGPGGGDELAAAATYLGLTQAELLTALQSARRSPRSRTRRAASRPPA